MKVIRSISELSGLAGPVHVAIGVFDGVHTGHRAVIGAAVDGARADGGSSVVLTFDPHPVAVLRPDIPLKTLTTIEAKVRLLGEAGADAVLVHPFNREFASCRAREFVKSIADTCRPLAQISVGWDWTFGRNREGNTDFLRELGSEWGFQATVIEPVRSDRDNHDGGDNIISSTAIRSALEAGEVARAAELLQRCHSVRGVVVEGRKLGRTIGFPTANLAVREIVELLPGDGVYAVRVHGADLASGGCEGVANLGVRPTVDSGLARHLEVHLFDFSGDLYGKTVDVHFVDRIRGEVKFADIEALRVQIAADVAAAAEVFRARSGSV